MGASGYGFDVEASAPSCSPGVRVKRCNLFPLIVHSECGGRYSRAGPSTSFGLRSRPGPTELPLTRRRAIAEVPRGPNRGGAPSDDPPTISSQATRSRGVVRVTLSAKGYAVLESPDPVPR